MIVAMWFLMSSVIAMAGFVMLFLVFQNERKKAQSKNLAKQDVLNEERR